MRKVQCADCGKRYDYDVDDFCPRCGSFNPPPDSGATRLEQDLLDRFRRPENSRSLPKRTASPSSGQTYRAGARAPSAVQARKKQKKKLGPLAIVVILAAVLLIGLPLVELAVDQVIDTVYQLTQELGSGSGEGAPTRSQALISAESQAVWEPYGDISLNGAQTVEVGRAWDPWLPDWVMEEHPDCRCVSVALWVEGSPGDARIYPPVLVTASGGRYEAAQLSAQAAADSGLEPISLADGVDGEERFGYLFFFLPEEETEGALLELTDGSPQGEGQTYLVDVNPV